MLRSLIAGMRALLHPAQRNAQIEEEVKSFFDASVDDKIRNGMSAEEARRAARGEIGSGETIRQKVWSAGWESMVDSLVRDLHVAARHLKRSPGFTVTAVLTLALGIGANIAVFSMVNGLLFRSLGVHDADRVVMIGFRQKESSWQQPMSLPEYQALRRQAQGVFRQLIAEDWTLDGLSMHGHRPDRVLSDYVSGDYFEALGVQPFLGRLFRPGEGVTPGADPEVVLSYGYWKQHFAGDAGIVGRHVALNGHPLTVIGIAPKDFRGLTALFAIQVYVPLAMQVPVENTPVTDFRSEANRELFVYARLRSGIGQQQANAALAVVAHRLTASHPRTEEGAEMRTFSLSAERVGGFDPGNNLGKVMGLFLGLSGMVLLLACVNVGNLVLVRASVRQREMAMRAALGARRSRLVRQMLTESILLGLAGGAAGVGLGLWGSSVLTGVNLETDLPMRLNFGMDWHVLAFSTGIAVAAGILVGLAPALRLGRTNPNVVLHEGGRGVAGGRSRFRNALVAAEVSAALVLLIVAGLFTRSLARTEHTRLGFNPAHVITAMMDPGEIGYKGAQTRDFYAAMLERVRALPGVETATTAGSIPFGLENNPADAVTVPGQTQPPGQQPPIVNFNIVGGEYFRTMEIPLLEGRNFDSRDNEKSPRVAIVSAAMAKRFWPREDAIGKTLIMSSNQKYPLQVVGVAGDARYGDPGESIAPYFYVPFLQDYKQNSMQALEVRTNGDPTGLVPELEGTIHGMAPDLPVFEIKTLRESLYSPNGLLLYEVIAAVAGVMGGLGLVLAIVGVYGVLSYVVQRKTAEIGVRIALGAQRRDILRVVYRQGLSIVAIGLAAGIGLSFALAHAVRSMIEVSPTDPATYLGVSATLTAVALLACYVPARRAAHIDPVEALRSE